MSEQIVVPDELGAAYPGIDLAYEIAVQSYEIAQKRFDAIESRAHNLLLFATTISLAIPAIVKSGGNLNFDSIAFGCAIGLYFFALTLGTYTRISGALKLVSPENLFDVKWLGGSPAEFKKNYLFFAGENFKINVCAINRKGRLLNATAIFFALEGFCLAIWVFGCF